MATEDDGGSYRNKTHKLLSDHEGLLRSVVSPVGGEDSASNGTGGAPNTDGLGFYTRSPGAPSDQMADDLNVIIPAVTCFCLGIFIASIVGFVVYRKHRRKWTEERGVTYSQNEEARIRSSGAGGGGTENKPGQYAVFRNDPLLDFFQNNEGTVSQDAQSALNFLVTPFVCNDFNNDNRAATSPTSSLTTSTSLSTSSPTTTATPRDRALLSLQNEIEREQRRGVPSTGSSSLGSVGTGSVVSSSSSSRAAPSGRLDWSLPDSDVVVNIPAGALPPGFNNQNSLKVALGANPLNVARRNDQIQLSPLLILSSPNVSRFNRPIEVRIPHRAHLTTDSAWTMQLRYSGTTHNNINKLDWLDGTQDMHGEGAGAETGANVTYRYDTDYVFVVSFIPGLFCVVGCGARKKKPLKVAAMAFAYPLPPQTCEPEPGQETGNCGVDIKIFFIDFFREAIQHLQKTEEEERGGLCVSEPLPLRMVNEKDWQVILVNADTPQWPFRVQDGQRLKSVPAEALYQDFGLGVSVDFRIFSKMPPDGGMDHFQATFSIAQRRRNPSNIVASLLSTQKLMIPRSAHSSVGSSISRESDESSPTFPTPLFHRDLLYSDIVRSNFTG